MIARPKMSQIESKPIEIRGLKKLPHVSPFPPQVGASDEYYWPNMMRILRRPFTASRDFLWCHPNSSGVTAAELHDLDASLLAATRGFAFVRKVQSIDPKALPRYLAQIRSTRRHIRPSPDDCAKVATTRSLITGHVWGEVE